MASGNGAKNARAAAGEGGTMAISAVRHAMRASPFDVAMPTRTSNPKRAARVRAAWATAERSG